MVIRLSFSPISTNSIRSERPVMMPGRISGNKTSRRNSALPGKLTRSRASAAGNPSPMEIAIAASATSRLFSTESHNGVSCASCRYQSSVRLRGGKPPTPPPLNEYTINTTIGRYKNANTSVACTASQPARSCPVELKLM